MGHKSAKHIGFIFVFLPYILVLFSNENYRPGRANIYKELSSYIYNI